MDFKSIAERIIQLKNDDLELRNNLIKEGKLWDGYNEEMEAMHNRNAKELNDIINKINYPTIDKVGKEASEAAWLIIQHSIGQPEFMKKCLRLLEQAVEEDKANPKNLAYLSDRIAVFEGKHQIYGTQFNWDKNGKLSPEPFDNLTKVNQRRKSIGLNTLEEQITIIRKQATIDTEIPPKNFDQMKRRMDIWRKKVGWLK